MVGAQEIQVYTLQLMAPSSVDHFHAILFTFPIFDEVIKREGGMEKGIWDIHKKIRTPNSIATICG